MVTPVKLIPGTLLTNAAVSYFTSPAKTQTIIKKLSVVNIHAANAHAVSIWLGTAAGNPQLLIDARPIGPLGTLDVTEAQNHVLAAGDQIWAMGDDAINLQIQASGVQIV
jgi:hypothetical protein